MFLIASSNRHFYVMRTAMHSYVTPSGIIVYDRIGREQRAGAPTAGRPLRSARRRFEVPAYPTLLGPNHQQKHISYISSGARPDLRTTPPALWRLREIRYEAEMPTATRAAAARGPRAKRSSIAKGTAVASYRVGFIKRARYGFSAFLFLPRLHSYVVWHERR